MTSLPADALFAPYLEATRPVPRPPAEEEVSALFLVRHGQASFGVENYDVLSPLGIRQARRLGEAWARRGKKLDALYTGPLERHKDTTRHLREGAKEAGVTYPEATVLPGLDEVDVSRLIAMAMELGGKRGEAPTPGYAAEMRELLARWASGDPEFRDLEPFEALSSRVVAAIERVIAAEGRGKEVAVVTSGGPIAALLRHALGLAPPITVDLLMTTANASVTELQYRAHAGGYRLGLACFNELSHLHHDPAMITQV